MVKGEQMNNKELKIIAKRLEELENEVLIEFGLHRHGGDFVKIDMCDRCDKPIGLEGEQNEK